MDVRLTVDSDEIERLLDEALPLAFDLGGSDSGDDRAVTLSEPREVAFIAGKGIRVRCSLTLEWSIPVLPRPVNVHSTHAFIEPTIETTEAGPQLVFRFSFEDLDVTFLPDLIDPRLARQLSDVLTHQEAFLKWDVARTFSLCLALPDQLAPPTNLDADVVDATLEVGQHALTVNLGMRLAAERERSATVNARDHPHLELVGTPPSSTSRLMEEMER